MKAVKLLTYIVFVLFVVACGNTAIYEKFEEIPEANWFHKHTAKLTFEITDTTKKYDLIMLVRHTTDFPYMNFWVNTNTVFPDGTSKEQKIDLPMADKTGKWFGKGFGNIKTNEVVIQQNAIMPQVGEYTLKINQLMRYEPVSDISDIGLRIEPSEVK